MFFLARSGLSIAAGLLALFTSTLGMPAAAQERTLVVSAFGGWFAGALADRYGRVRVLQVAILWYAFFTFLCGFANDFYTLFTFRALQGLGFGGEWAAGAVLMGEVIRDKYRGRAVGIVQTGWSIGWGAAALLYTFFFAIMPEAIAWTEAVRRLRDAGFDPVPSFNPYWDRDGATFEDPDGYRIVLQKAAWTR